jgi:16S rRNA (guanine966-N2)-methyltransferase
VTAARARRGEVRILAGRWKGRALEIPGTARPTSGRARQALFNVLQPRVAGARVLDLYAGSGAVGLEAVSRGAASTVLVEPHASGLRRALIRLAPGEGEVRLVASSAADAIDGLVGRGERFDIVFADPPYDLSGENADLARASQLLEPEGILVLQRDAGAAPEEIPGLRLRERRSYGRNVFLFFGML